MSASIGKSRGSIGDRLRQQLLGENEMLGSRSVGRRQDIFFIALTLMMATSAAIPQVTDEQGVSDTVDVDVAQAVAAEHLPKYFPGEWLYLNHYVFYGLDGAPAAYAFVFKKPGTDMKTASELEEHVSLASEARYLVGKQLSDLAENTPEHTELRQQQSSLRRSLYMFDKLATMVTGATTTSELVIRCYRGLPPIVAEEYELQTQFVAQKLGGNLELGRIVFVSSSDIRYEVTAAGEAKAAAEGQKPMSDDAYSLSVKGQTFKRIREERERLKRRKERRDGEMAEWDESDRKDYEKAVEQRNRKTHEKWSEYISKPSRE